MTDSDTESDERRPGPDSLADWIAARSRYDALLAGIPTAFLLAVLAARALGFPLTGALAGASLLTVAVTADALFVHPPDEAT